MNKNILITGGAGFIGSHLADKLIINGYNVRILDNLNEQVHGGFRNPPSYLNPAIEILIGDIRDRKIVEEALEDIDAVFHFASRGGLGQSMYEIKEFIDVNNTGTAILLEEVIKKNIEKLVVGSCMSIYGEGSYTGENGTTAAGIERSIEQLRHFDWEIKNSRGHSLTPQPTPETKIPCLSNVCALSKYDQEKLSLIIGKAYNIPVTSLRFFNVYGTRQSLSNPYTGVLAIFASRLLNNNPPLIFEDGNQKRDFVSVHDVTSACLLALESKAANGKCFNIGSGKAYSVKDAAEKMTAIMEKDIKPVITEKYRIGDIRHCYADISLAREILGYKPQVSLEEGLTELAAWLEGQTAEDNVIRARQELLERGLTA